MTAADIHGHLACFMGESLYSVIRMSRFSDPDPVPSVLL